MVKTKDLRAMTIDELEAKLVEDKKEQFNLRIQQSTGQLTNTAQVRKVRKEIAQINTLIAERVDLSYFSANFANLCSVRELTC